MKKQKTFLSKKELNELQEKVDQKLDETPLEKGDILAMTIAALLTLLPIVALILFIFFIFGWIFTGGY